MFVCSCVCVCARGVCVCELGDKGSLILQHAVDADGNILTIPCGQVMCYYNTYFYFKIILIIYYVYICNTVESS